MLITNSIISGLINAKDNDKDLVHFKKRPFLFHLIDLFQGGQGEPGTKGERGDPGLPVRTLSKLYVHYISRNTLSFTNRRDCPSSMSCLLTTGCAQLKVTNTWTVLNLHLCWIASLKYATQVIITWDGKFTYIHCFCFTKKTLVFLLITVQTPTSIGQIKSTLEPSTMLRGNKFLSFEQSMLKH